MDPSFVPPSTTPLADSPLSLFSTPSATQSAFNAMMEGASIHHTSVINSVLNSDPIKEFVEAKDSFARKERLSHPYTYDAPSHSDFPPIQDDRAQSNRPQQADLALISSPYSPCSPQAFHLAATGSTFSQKSMELMHLSPPIMEKLEADLVLLQKKYGLLSHLEASTVQAELLSSKQAALGTFVSPLRAMNPSFPNQSPSSLSTNSAQTSQVAIPARETASPARKIDAPAPPPAPAPAPAPAPSDPVPARKTAGPSSSAPSVRVIDTSTVPAPHARETASQKGSPIIPAAQFMESAVNVRGNAPLSSSSNSSEAVRGYAPSNAQISSAFVRGKALPTVPPIVRGNPRGSAPIAAPNGTVSAQMCSEPVRGNAPMHYSATQCTMPVQGSSWAARLGGSRSTSSTPLSYIPPTLIAAARVYEAKSSRPTSGNIPSSRLGDEPRA